MLRLEKGKERHWSDTCQGVAQEKKKKRRRRKEREGGQSDDWRYGDKKDLHAITGGPKKKKKKKKVLESQSAETQGDLLVGCSYVNVHVAVPGPPNFSSKVPWAISISRLLH